MSNIFILSGKEKLHLLRVKGTGLRLGLGKFGKSGKWERFWLTALGNDR